MAVQSSAQLKTNTALQTEIVLSHSGVSPGGKGAAAVIFNVPPEYHITSLETGLFFIKAAPLPGFNIGEPQYPPAVDYQGDRVYKGRVKVLIDFTIDENVSPGEYRLNLEYGYQFCDEVSGVCHLPQVGAGEAVITVLPPGASPLPSGDEIFRSKIQPVETDGKTLAERFASALEGSMWAALILIFIAGILTSFTPCVYPVIPITVGFIGARADGRKSTGFILSIFLVLGLASVYSVLGVIAAATGSVFGAYTQHPAVLIVIALIFALMGISMMGAFEISIPASIQGKLQTRRTGFIGAVLVGMVTGLVAAPCTGPVLVALLAWVAGTGSILIGFIMLFTYALGLGMLFIVIGTFAGAVSALPGAGKWMETIKKIFGFALFAGAAFILKPLLGAGVYHLLWGIILIFAGVHCGALEFTAVEKAAEKKLSRAMGIILLAGGLLFFIDGFRTAFGLRSAPARTLTTETGIEWMMNDAIAAFAEAESSGKGVVMDFYADWCAACRELDEKTWPHRNVVSAGGDWIFLKVDMTRPSRESKALQDEYEVRGLPTVIFFRAEGSEIRRFSGFKPPEEVAEILREPR